MFLQILTLYSSMTLREHIYTTKFLCLFWNSMCYFPGHVQFTDIKGYLVTLGRENVINLGLVLGLRFATLRDLPTDFLNHMIIIPLVGQGRWRVEQGRAKLEVSYPGAQKQPSPAKWDCKYHCKGSLHTNRRYVLPYCFNTYFKLF